MSISAKTLGCR